MIEIQVNRIPIPFSTEGTVVVRTRLEETILNSCHVFFLLTILAALNL
jgi:hypothetical protein